MDERKKTKSSLIAELTALRQQLDQTEQRQSELQRIYDQSIDMLGVASFDGYFTRLSPAWEKTLGHTPEELMSRPYLDFVHPQDREATIAEAQKLTTGAVSIFFDNRYRCKDGSFRWLRWNVTPAVDEELLYFVARDVTELKRADQQVRQYAAELEAVNAELESFSYSVSHDLRAPLRAIDGFSQAFAEDYEDKVDERGRDYLRRIRAATQRMAQMIDSLLELSRVSRSAMKREEVNLTALVRGLAAGLKDREPSRKVKFAFHEDMLVRGDRNLLSLVMQNLMENAWKFTSNQPQARIEIGHENRGGKPAFFVRDNGAGFDNAYADKLFSAFQRLHGEEEFPGVGVGLATVRRIIQRHGGRAWAEGEIDKGATFYFTLS